MFKLQFLVFLLLRESISQGQWRCSNESSSDDYLFPDLGDSDPNPSEWQDSMHGKTYVYPISSSQVNCSGMVAGIEFCYRTSMENQTNLFIFNLLVLNQNGDSFNVTKSIPVYSTPSIITSPLSSMRNMSEDSQEENSPHRNDTDISSFCLQSEQSDTEVYCCDIMKLEGEDRFQFPTTNFAIGVTTPDSTSAILQNFRNNFALQEVYSVPFYFTNMSVIDGDTWNLMGQLVHNQSFHVLRLRISTPSFTDSDTPPIANFSTATSLTSGSITPTTASVVMSEFTTYLAEMNPVSSFSSTRDMPILHTTSTSMIGGLQTFTGSTTPSAAQVSTATSMGSASTSSITTRPFSSVSETSTPYYTSAMPDGSVTSNGYVSTTTTTEDTETEVVKLVGGILGAVAMIMLLLVSLFVIKLGRNRCHSRQSALTFNNATYYVDDTQVNIQNQDVELNSLRNDYAEIGPHANNGNKGSSLLNHNGYDDSQIQVAYYSIVNEEMPMLLPAERAGGGSSNAVELCHLQDQKPAEYEAIYITPADDVNALYELLEEILSDKVCKVNISIGSLLGSGQFGDVFEGFWERREDNVEVAVKTLKEGSDEGDKVKFLQEAAIMGQFKHPNVVSTYGVVTDREPFMLVMEFLKKGDLRNYMLSMRTDDKGVSPEIDDHELLSYCRQVASGMTYLSNKAFVHRDLAARNILVSDDRICKIADFGMARDLMDENYYVSHGGLIPVKWTAPEAIGYKKYSTASDVWSFGVVMYEIWSVGHKPFEAVDNGKILHLINKGYRLPPPPGCPRAIYNIMMSCWNPLPDSRPDFTEVSTQLSVSNSKLLHWSQEDKLNFPEAFKLGANLACADKLYKDLQLKCKKASDNDTPTNFM